MKIKPTLVSIPFKIINSGAEGLPDDISKSVKVVNASCLVAALLAFPVGNIFYYYTDLLEILLPAMIEGTLFLSMIFLNKYRYYNAATIGMFIIHCLFALYFGAVLGPFINIILMGLFLVGIAVLIFTGRNLLIILSAAITTILLLEINYYHNFIEPLEISKENQYRIRWIALASFLTFNGVVFHYNIKIKQGLIFKAVQSAKALKIFVYKVAHEIRNELNSISLIAQLLKREIKVDESLKKIAPYVDLLFSSIGNTRNIINNVLDLAQIDDGEKENMERETFLLKPFFNKIVSLNRIKAKTRGIKLRLLIDENLPDIVECDTLKLNQIITNLLGNAIKYADKESTVVLNIGKESDRWKLSVTNKCPDIPLEKQGLLFDMFFTEKRNQHIEGTGLGLYIVKSKVSSLNGFITLKSKGGITTFAVTLPLKVGKVDDIVEENEEVDIDLSTIHVIVADDNEMNALLLGKLLKHIGCEISVASNGLEVLQEVEKKIPDIIILDYHMPFMNGKETLKNLQNNPKWKTIPVIISSGEGYNQDIDFSEERLITDGARAILVKPITEPTLIKLLKQHLPHASDELLQE